VAREDFEYQTAALVGRLLRLLNLDGHGSHLIFQFVQFCPDHGILLQCLPSHSTHLLQPLDVGLFAPYHHYYGCEVDDYQRSGHNSQTQGIKKYLFIRMVANARKKTFTSSNICKAFEGARIWPLSAQKVLGKMRLEVSSRHDPFGLIATARKSKDIRRRVQVPERLLDTCMASLSLKDDVQTMERTSQVMITRVKTIMRELGHQLCTEIAQWKLYQEQSKKLQRIDPIYNKTDRRKLTEATISTGADLMQLRDIRLVNDTKPQSATKVHRSTSLQKEKQSQNNKRFRISVMLWLSMSQSK